MEDENEYGDEEWDDAEASMSSATLESNAHEPVEASHEENPVVDEDAERAYDSEWSDQESPARRTSHVVYSVASLEQQTSKSANDLDKQNESMAYQSRATEISIVSTEDNDNDEPNGLSNRKADAASKKTHSERIIQSHAQRVRRNPPSVQNTESHKRPQGVDWGAEGARVAAERIRQFRELTRLQDEQQKIAHTIEQQKRYQYRASNRPMHEALGVADISAQQRLTMLRSKQRKQKKKLAEAAQLERKERWYNRQGETGARVPLCMAAAHVSSLNKRELHLQRGKQKVQEDRKRDIHDNLMRLQDRARSIITKNQGAYAHGSYLLRRSLHEMPTTVTRGDHPTAGLSLSFDSFQSDALAASVSKAAPTKPTRTIVIAIEHPADVESSVLESALGINTKPDDVSASTPMFVVPAPCPVTPIESVEFPMASMLTSNEHPAKDSELNVAFASTDATQERSATIPIQSPEDPTPNGLTNYDCSAQMSSDCHSDNSEALSLVAPTEKTPESSMPSTEIRHASPLDAPETAKASEFLVSTTVSPEKSAVDIDSLTEDGDNASESFEYADDFTA